MSLNQADVSAVEAFVSAWESKQVSMPIAPSLRVLIVEDDPVEAESMVHELRNCGLSIEWERVDTAADYLTHLNQPVDLILADYSLPQFGAIPALHMLRQRDLSIPLIVVTGPQGEEAAVECMKLGAADYLLRDHLARLGPAVESARQAQHNRAVRSQSRDQAEVPLRQSAALNQAIFDSLDTHIAIVDCDGTITNVNEAWSQFAATNGDPVLSHTGVGVNYIEVCRQAAQLGDKLATQNFYGLYSVLAGRIATFTVEYPCHTPTYKRWFALRMMPLRLASGGAVVTHADITARKLAEENLTISEKRFRTLIENASDAIALISADGTILYESPSNVRALGYTPEEQLGKKMLDLIHPDDRDEAISQFRPLQREAGGHLIACFRFRHKNGSWRWLEGAATNLLDEPGIQAIVINYRDMTERRQAEAELERQHHLLRTLIDHLPDYIYIKDTASRFVINNQAHLSILGLTSQEDAIGKNDFDFFPPDLAAKYYADEQDILQSGQLMLNQEERVWDEQARMLRWILTTKIPLWDRAGQITGLVGISHDITHRKQAEEALRQSEERFSKAFHASPVGILIATLNEGTILDANEGFLRLTGYEWDEVINRSVYDIRLWASPDTRPALVQALREQRVFRDVEAALLTGTGEIRHGLVSAEQIRLGEQDCVLTIIYDITDRKRTQDELMQANMLRVELEKTRELLELKERFITMVSHEYRTPLATILSSADNLRLYFDRMTPEQKATRFDRIAGQVQHMVTLLDNVLTLERLAGGAVAFKPEPLDLDVFVREVNDAFQQAHQTHHLTYTITGSPCAVWLDRQLIRQILTNLLSNAAKYSPAGTTIEVGLAFEPNQVVFQVSDHGIGIPERDQARLFTAFYRAANVGATPGTGLGLSIAKHAVNLHGGSITIDSRIGVGTTFTVTIPLRRQQSPNTGAG